MESWSIMVVILLPHLDGWWLSIWSNYRWADLNFGFVARHTPMWERSKGLRYGIAERAFDSRTKGMNLKMTKSKKNSDMRDSLRTRLIIIFGAPFLNYWVKNQGARSFAFITNQGNRANGRPQSYGKDPSSWDVIFYELQTKSPKLRPTPYHDDLSIVETDLPVFARSIQQHESLLLPFLQRAWTNI